MERPALSTSTGGQIHVGSEIRDSVSLLDVVYANQFEGLLIDPKVVEQTEENFYRGAPPTWLNFHISEKAKSEGTGTTFIKRDGYGTLRQQICRKRQGPDTSKVKLFYQQGCGGTTLAMQVLWDLRRTFRCAALTSSTSDISSVVKEVVHLFTAGSLGNHNTVLLLMNNELILENLQDSIMEEIAEQKIDTDMPVVIILNCVRASEHVIHEKEHSYTVKQHVILKRELSDNEKKQLNKKKEELLKRYGDKSQQFHGFNILETNFSQAYILEACAVIKTIKMKKIPPKTQLAAYLSLLNAYVPGSYLLKSQCLNFLYHEDTCGSLSLEDQMEPFSHLIITFQQDTRSERKVCMAHPLIAQNCIEILAEAGVTRSDTARNFLTCFCIDEVPPCLLGFIKDMLTKRDTKKEEKNNDQARHHGGPKRGDVDHEKFSTLVLHIDETESEEMSASVLKVASDKFVQNSLYPQALARFYYSKVEDFNKAEKWAKTAKERDPIKSFIADTLGQVYKNHLRNMDSKAKPREILQLAKKAIEAFKEEEQLAENEHDGKTNVLREFNTRGMFGYLQVCKILFDQLVNQNDTWRGVLTKKVSLGSVIESLGDKKLFAYSELVDSLRDEVEKRFEFFDNFLTYSQPVMKKNDAQYVPREISECYRKYVGDSAPKHKEKSDKTIQKLKEKLAATSAGVLSCLDIRRTVSELNQIASWWNEICLSKDTTRHALVNYILANIMLTNKNEAPSSSDYQNAFRQQMPFSSRDVPEFHLLCLLMFWPTDDEDRLAVDLNQLIGRLKSSYECEYQKLFRSRYLCPLFFIGKGKGLSRFVHRRVLEILWTQNALKHPNTNWRTEKIFDDPNVQERLLKVEGVVRNYRLYATFGSTEIEVDVNQRYSLRKSGRVFFYLGFTINGPVAYKVQRTILEGTSGKHGACGGVKDSSGWPKLQPAVKPMDEGQTFSLESEAGCYECSVSALRWVCKQKVTITYQFSSWEEHGQILACTDYMPAGPILDIVVSAGKIEEVHLPHWIDCSSTTPDMFAVLHVDTCGYLVEPLSKVTSSHVTLNAPTFSPRGVMIRKKLGLSVKVYYDLLIYKQTKKEFLTLHVYLVPPDRDVQQKVEKKETSYGSVLIPKPSPDTSLQMQDDFFLTTDTDTAEISPEKLKLSYDRRNFFEVFLRNAESDFGLKLQSKPKKTGSESIVWSCTMRTGDYKSKIVQCEQASGLHFVDRHRTALIDRVSETDVILDKLRDIRLISSEQYDAVRALKIDQNKMRDILKIVTSAGTNAKDRFYGILRSIGSMRYLMDELEES